MKGYWALWVSEDSHVETLRVPCGKQKTSSPRPKAKPIRKTLKDSLPCLLERTISAFRQRLVPAFAGLGMQIETWVYAR